MTRRLMIYAFALAALMASGMVASCAGKQASQVRQRFIPENKKTVYIGEPLNNTTRPELGRLLADYLANYYQLARELTLSRDFSSADLYLDMEINHYLEQPVYDLSTGRSNVSRYLIKLNISIRDIATKDYYIKDQPLEISWLGPTRPVGEALTATLGQVIFRKVSFGIDSLVVNGSVPITGQFGYEGLEDDLSKSYFERQNLLQDTAKNRIDYKQDPSSDYRNITNSAESNRTRSIQNADRGNYTR